MNFDFTFYKPTDLEQWINQKYQRNGIHYASDMDIDHIAAIFNIEVHTYSGRCLADWKDGEYSYILLNAYLTEEQKREHFFHELCHPIKHVGRQHELPDLFTQLQEIQAAQFQLCAAMPFYMLEEYKDISNWQTYIKVLSEEFKLPIPFVEKRIAQVERRISQGRADYHFITSRRQPPPRPELTKETLRILDKLEDLKSKKGAV